MTVHSVEVSAYCRHPPVGLLCQPRVPEEDVLGSVHFLSSCELDGGLHARMVNAPGEIGDEPRWYRSSPSPNEPCHGISIV